MSLSSGTFRTTVIKGRGLRKEGATTTAISPGDFVQRTSAASMTFIRHNTAGARHSLLIAVENELFGNGIDIDYASGDRVLAEAVYPGMEVYAGLAANAAAITKGDILTFAADGTLKKGATVWTDNSGGAVSTTLALITNPAANATTSLTADVLAIKNAIASLAAQVGGYVMIAVALESVDNSAIATKARVWAEII